MKSCSDFGFEFAEIFVIENRLPAINDTGSRRLPLSPTRGVVDSPFQRYGELIFDFYKKTLCIGDAEIRRLPV